MLNVKFKPNIYLLESITYLLALKQLSSSCINQLKELTPNWKLIADENAIPILNNIEYMLENYNTIQYFDDYVVLSKPVDFYYKLYNVVDDRELASTIEQKIFKYYLTMQYDNLIHKYEITSIDPENIENIYKELTSAFTETYSEILETKQSSNIKVIKPDDVNEIATNIETTIRIPCFIPEIDLITNGFIPGHFYLFAGGLGGGKSALLMNLALGFSVSTKLFANKIIDALKLDYIKNKNELEPVVLYISLENNLIQIQSRYFAILKDLTPFQNLAKGADTPLYKLFNALNVEFISYELIEDAVYAYEVKNIIEQTIINGKFPVVVVIDYLDEFNISQNVDIRHKFGIITKILRTIAYKYNIIIVTATQLNRKGIEGKLDVTSLSESIEHAKRTDFLSFIYTFNGTQQELISNNIPSSKLFDSSNDKYPIMHMKVVKNRISLQLQKINILSCLNSKLGFKSLVYGKDWELSLAYGTSKILLDENLENLLLDARHLGVIQSKAVHHIHNPDDNNPGSMFSYIYRLYATKEIVNNDDNKKQKPNILEKLNLEQKNNIEVTEDIFNL